MDHISGQPCSALPDTKAVELSQLKLGAFSFMLVFLFKESFELFLTTFSNKSLWHLHMTLYIVPGFVAM